MPPGRPPKRPGDGIDSPLDSPSGASKSKLPRLERPPEDFSSVVKSKLQSYTRTGQACDRCKVRKIRCDQRPDGCTHCTQQNIECYVTDRVTGRTERRGYLQQLEREKNSLLSHIRDLEKLFEDRGVQVRPWQAVSAYEQGTSSLDAEGDAGPAKDQWTQYGSLCFKEFNAASQQSRPGSSAMLGQQQSPATLPPPPATRPIGSHLGVLQDSSPLSCINGTQLSILGTTIDITSFDAPDMDGPPAGTSKAAPLYNKSLQSFYNSAAKINPPVDAPLPSRDEAFSYSEWFFVMVGAFVPVLHKPTHLKMLARIYDDRDYKPTTSELVIVHMVFAIMYYQFGVRSGDNAERKAQLNELSNEHYHWCLDKVWDIASEGSMASMQAVTLISVHCRGFPKPGPAYLIATLAWNRAIEMNLHRAYLKSDEPTNLENELRKRIWWSLFMVVVMLCGRLGKPMPIRAEDIDVEYPVLVADEYLTDDGILEHEDAGGDSCYWLVALSGFKLGFLFMDMWNNVYAVRQDARRYVDSVRRVEHKFRAFQRELPDELRPDRCKPANRVVATYLQGSVYEFLFCLRHPSRCATGDAAFVAENYRATDDAAKNMLRVASELARLKSLDTTWYQMAVYVGVVFTLLASKWERRVDITSAELAELRENVSLGMSVISEILKYIGTNESRILGQITAVIDRTMTSIEQDMNSQRSSRTSTPAGYSQQQQQQPQQQQQQLSSRSSNKHDDYGPPSRQGRAPRSASGTPVPITNGGSAEQPMPVARMGGGVPPQQQQQQQQQQQNNNPYYASPLTSINTAYSQMGYPELGSSGVPTPTTGSAGTPYLPGADDGGASHHQYLYATSAAATAAAAQMVGHHAQGPGTSPQTGPGAGQQHMGGGGGGGGAYGGQGGAPQTAAPAQQQQQQQAQHHQHHQHQHHHQQHQQHHQHHQQQPHAPWMSGAAGPANPWNEWTNAMVDPASHQDRYSASALLTLGGGQRGGPGDATGDMGPGVPTAQSGQWPMLVFHPPPNVSGA